MREGTRALRPIPSVIGRARRHTSPGSILSRQSRRGKRRTGDGERRMRVLLALRDRTMCSRGATRPRSSSTPLNLLSPHGIVRAPADPDPSGSSRARAGTTSCRGRIALRRIARSRPCSGSSCRRAVASTRCFTDSSASHTCMGVVACGSCRVSVGRSRRVRRRGSSSPPG